MSVKRLVNPSWQLREPNNHTVEKAREWRRLAVAVGQTYGHRYQRSVDYLSGLADNAFWANAELPELSWLAQDRHAPNPAQPRYIMHEAVLNALAPAVPLRAVWGGDRRV